MRINQPPAATMINDADFTTSVHAILASRSCSRNDYNADDAVGYGFAVPPHLLQSLPRFGIDLHLPLAVRQAEPGLLERKLGRNQGPALLGDLYVRHCSRIFCRPAPRARAAIARPGKISQLNRSKLFCGELTCDTSTVDQP
jgi:hypothetical protein